MRLFGYYKPDNGNGLDDIEIAAKYKDGIIHPIAVIFMLAHGAVVVPFLGRFLTTFIYKHIAQMTSK